MTLTEPDLEGRLRSLVRQEDRLMRILETVRRVNPPEWIVAAGAIRNMVWDRLSGYASPSQLGDVDVLYFEKESSLVDRDVSAELARLQPEHRWEAANQAVIHEWLLVEFGIEVRPLRSSAEGLATFSETATAVGVRLETDDSLAVVASAGLEDLFSLILRPNPRCPDPGLFDPRLATKGFQRRWPNLRILPVGPSA